jgi:phage recombination protein Bet
MKSASTGPKSAKLSDSVAKATTCTTANTTLSDAFERALARSGMSYGTFVRCVTQNAFRSLVVWSEADMERLLLTCEALGLSPMGRDVYAVQPSSGAGVLIAVGVDGWSRIVNQHPQFDGMEFEESENLVGGVPSWIRCTIHRRDRRVAMSVKEYLCEAVRDTGAWQTHPRRMLRHKAMVQCARLAFELPASSGIYDADEAERVVQAQSSNTHTVRENHDAEKSRKRASNAEAISAGTTSADTSASDSVTSGACAPNEINSGLGQGSTMNCQSPQSQVSKLRRSPSNTLLLIGALTRQSTQ